MHIASLLAFFVACAFAEEPFRAINSLSEVPDGDAYNRSIPTATRAVFEGTKVAILMGDYGEDTELYYQYHYFIKRGAEVHIYTPNGGPLYIADFIKPNYIIPDTQPLSAAVGQEFEVVYVAGGAPSNKAIRNNEFAQRVMWDQYLSGRLLALICAGSEALIDIGLATGYHLTGSPTSRRTLELAGARYHLVPTVWAAPNVLTGQGPAFQREFVVEIEKWRRAKMHYEDPDGPDEMVELDPDVFHTPAGLSDLPAGETFNETRPAVTNDLAGRRIAIVISHAASRMEVQYAYRYFADRHATVDFVAPGWENQGNILLSDNVRPTFFATGALSPTAALSRSYAAVLVLGTPWAVTVLSSDGDILRFLAEKSSAGAVMGAVGLAPETLARAGLLFGRHATGLWTGVRNLRESGVIYQDIPVVVDGHYVTARNSDNMWDFMVAVERAMGNRPRPQPAALDAAPAFVGWVTMGAALLILILLTSSLLARRLCGSKRGNLRDEALLAQA